MNFRIIIYFLSILVLNCSLSGCALINAPLALAGKLLGLASHVPMPPPGVFF